MGAEPMIVEWGRTNMKKFKEDQYESALKRAFVRCACNSISLDSNTAGQRFLAACTAWALDKGYVYQTSQRRYFGDTIYEFELTDAGKAFMAGTEQKEASNG